MHCDSSSAIPSSLAIARAVSLWSPVIIIVLIPALLKVFTESFASGRGGSIIPTKPTNVRSSSLAESSSSLIPRANTLRAPFAISVAALFISSMCSFVISFVSPFIYILLHLFKSMSMAPLV